MGGFGSGRWRHGRRRTVEETPFLDADEVMLRHVGDLGPDRRSWTVSVIGQVLDLVATLTPLGRRRWWWLCPSCGARRKRLYSVRWAGYRCRECLGLAYARSQRNRRPNRFELAVIGPDAGLLERGLYLEEKAEASAERRRRWRRKRREALKQAGLAKR